MCSFNWAMYTPDLFSHQTKQKVFEPCRRGGVCFILSLKVWDEWMDGWMDVRNKVKVSCPPSLPRYVLHK